MKVELLAESLPFDPADPTNIGDVGRPANKGELPNWAGMHEYEVDLGHPIATVSLDTLKSPEKIQAAKEKLRMAIHFAQLNRVHEKLQIPYFYWFAKTTPDSTNLHPAFYALPVPADARRNVLTELAPSLVSLSLLYKQNGETGKLKAIQTLLNDLPLSTFTTEVQQMLPEIMPVFPTVPAITHSDISS
jgi:hypothetical protein